MKIAVIGSGHIGSGLEAAWRAAGHDVRIGARGAVAEAVSGAEVVALAVPHAALDDVLQAAGDLTGKVVIDCTNAVGRGMTLVYGPTTSAAEELQKKIPGAHVFKSFNAQGAENLANPVYGSTRASNFFCGDDPAGRAKVKRLVEEVGFEAVDAGPLRNARLLESLMLLWVACAQTHGTRDLAFALLRR